MSQDTIALQLERDRLEHRLRRINTVIRALRERAEYHRAAVGMTPGPLQDAIKTFELERDELRRRLLA